MWLAWLKNDNDAGVRLQSHHATLRCINCATAMCNLERLSQQRSTKSDRSLHMNARSRNAIIYVFARLIQDAGLVHGDSSLTERKAYRD